MTYTPTLIDAAADLRRCAYLSFDSPSFQTFWINANKIISDNSDKLNKVNRNTINQCLQNIQDETLPEIKRQEDLLMAAILIS